MRETDSNSPAAGVDFAGTPEAGVEAETEAEADTPE